MFTRTLVFWWQLSLTFAFQNASSFDANAFRRQLALECPYITWQDLPSGLAVRNNHSKPLEVEMEIMLLRFVGIDDIEQQLSMLMDFQMTWKCPCEDLCHKLLDQQSCQNIKDIPGIIYQVNMRKKELWHPVINHENAAFIAKPFDNVFTNIKVQPFPTVSFKIYPRLILDTTCSTFSFKKFPFDTQTCVIKLFSTDNTRLVTYNVTEFYLDPNKEALFIDDTEVWELVGFSHDVKQVLTDENWKFSKILLSITFRRKPGSYLTNVIIIPILLFILQIGAIILPPQMPDRPAFCIAVVMVFVFLLGLIFSMIPISAETVYLVQIISAKLFAGVAITIYALITCPLAKMQKFKDWKIKFCFCAKIYFLRGCDIIFSFVIFSIILLLDVYYLSLMI